MIRFAALLVAASVLTLSVQPQPTAFRAKSARS